MQLMHFINWLGKQLIWNDIISFNSIENQRKQLHGIPQQLEEQLIWNDIIFFNSIGNGERKQWYQLHGIGCN